MVVENRESELAATLEDVVDKSVRAVEEIHRSISDLPFNVLERLGVMAEGGGEVKKVHDTSVAAIYETIREVNSRVAKLTDELGEAPPKAKKTRSKKRVEAV